MNIPLFDGHCDTILLLDRKELPDGALRENNLHIDLKRARKFSPGAQFFALFHSPRANIQGDPFAKFYRRFKTEMELNSDIISFCRNAQDARKAAEEGKYAAFLSIENATLIGCDPNRLQEVYDAGVRAVCVAWNNATILTGTNVEDTDRGLSEQGKEFVKRCFDLGIIVDVSHISDPAFWDIAEMAKGPIIASHSNSRDVYYHTRNLTDDQFKKLIELGGTTGINMFGDFISDTPTIDDVIEHIEHFWMLGGQKNVAIGADFDGCDVIPEGMHGIEDMDMLYEALLKKNYNEDLLRDLFYNNLMRVVEEVCGI